MSAYRIVGGDRREYGPLDAAQIRQWIAEGRVNGDTLTQEDGGPWKRLSQFPEFADALSALPQPLPLGTEPAQKSIAAPPTPVALHGLTDPKSAVTGPAVALLIVAVMDLGLTVLEILATVTGWGLGGMPPGMHFHSQGLDPEVEQIMRIWAGPIGLVGNVLSLIVSGFILLGALRMLSLKSYGLCMVAAVLAVVPCTTPCCCLGIAAGIWALVVLTRPEVKQAFG